MQSLLIDNSIHSLSLFPSAARLMAGHARKWIAIREKRTLFVGVCLEVGRITPLSRAVQYYRPPMCAPLC